MADRLENAVSPPGHDCDRGLHDGEDLRNLPFLDRKAELARLLRDTEAGILFDEHVAEDCPIVFEHACRLGAEGFVSKRVDRTYRSGAVCGVDQGSESGEHRVQRERSEKCK